MAYSLLRFYSTIFVAALFIRLKRKGVYYGNDQNVSTQSTTTAQTPSRDRVKADTAKMIDKAKTAGQQQVESGKQTAASQGETVARVIQEASSQLKEKNMQTLGEYTSELGTAIKSFADSLHNKSVDDLVTDIRDIARRNPTAFILGSVAIGIGISRFFKASGERRQQSHSRGNRPAYDPESSVNYE